jgi:amino acid adenylation domain-containing protein
MFFASAAEKSETERNAAMTAFSKDEIEGSVGARFHKVALARPTQVALQTERESVTFSELDSQSDTVAGYLLGKCGAASDPIAILLEQGIHSLIATLGVLKAGKSFVVFPPLLPEDRLASIWDELQHPVILSQPAHQPLADAITHGQGTVLDMREALACADPVTLPSVSPDLLAAIFFTSATTGDPKGVMWSQRMMLHTAWQNGSQYKITPADRMTHLSAYGFGAATTACFAALLNGATLFLRTEKTDDLKSILDWLRKAEITILSITSFGLIRQQESSKTVRKANVPRLRWVLLGGDDLYRSDIGVFRRLFSSQTSLAYRLAGSETMLAREIQISENTPLLMEKIPVGFSVPDKELLLLDEHGSPVPQGQEGEIAIQSRYLASGYWRQPGLSEAKFHPVPDRPEWRIYLSGDMGRLTIDGQLEFLGRKDNTVKIRGFSIQLEAVESALQALEGIQECAATALQVSTGEKRLAAYIVPAAGAALLVERLRVELAKTLPRFMIPTVFVFLETLPRTATGKVERSKLPPPGTIRPPLQTAYMPPRDEDEKKLCVLWAALLHLDLVGIYDNFFDLGGDSLLAMQLVTEIEQLFGKEIPSLFFRDPTIDTLLALWRTGALPQPETAAPGSKTPPPTAPLRGGREWLSRPGVYMHVERGRWAKIRRDPTEGLQLAARVAIASCAMRLSYAGGSRFTAWFCNQPWFVDFFFRPHIRLFRRFVAELGGCPDAPPHALEISLAGNILWSRHARRSIDYYAGPFFLDVMRKASVPFWRDLARLIERSSEDEFRRFFSFSGIEHIEAAYRKGRGVILATYHNSVNQIVVPALVRRLQCKPIPTISINRAIRLEIQRINEEKTALPAVEEAALISDLAIQGQRILTQGGIIQIVPDNTQDVVGDRPLVMGGREHKIKPGIAEMALLTGAAIVPQYATRRMDGSLQMVIAPPFEVDPQKGDHNEQVYSILRQYATFVDRSWKAAPENMRWPAMERFLAKPRI